MWRQRLLLVPKQQQPKILSMQPQLELPTQYCWCCCPLLQRPCFRHRYPHRTIQNRNQDSGSHLPRRFPSVPYSEHLQEPLEKEGLQGLVLRPWL